MEKRILVFGAGRSATVLIDYLKALVNYNNWHLTVADSNLQLAEMKTANAPGTSAVKINIEDQEERQLLISNADLVISMLPASLHLPVATDCILHKKHLLTASYVSEEIKALAGRIQGEDILFLCEMGLDPGIDHMSAMQIIDNLTSSGAVITSFTSHCGGLVAPESDDNPWHYKISWNAANVVKAGAAGAVFKENGKEKFVSYQQLFHHCKHINIPGLGDYAYYPNRDSLHYMPLYGLQSTTDFLRTTLRHPHFCSGWNVLVQAGLTSETRFQESPNFTFEEWSRQRLSHSHGSEEQEAQFAFLGLFDKTPVPAHLQSPAEVLQYLLETRLMLGDQDKDMIIMMHEFEYNIHQQNRSLKSLLVVKGEDHLHTAMAKTVGLPLGIAAKLLLQNKIALRGLHIPVSKEIYEPVLRELNSEGILFEEIDTSS